MDSDIRDKPRLGHEDILTLNFIRVPGIFHYRRHYRTGLRSHIMEVLHPGDVLNERKGLDRGGVRWFPRARPLKMLRLFRTRFGSAREALEELERVKLVTRFLVPDHVAMSNEFLVDYRKSHARDILLCGLQEYVEGEVLDPWSPLDRPQLLSLFRRMARVDARKDEDGAERWLQRVRLQARELVFRLKRMILEAHHVPDLAGVGNLLVTRGGQIRLVDINNISRVTFAPAVPLDDRGYPVCDKSIEALFLLETKLTGSAASTEENIYKTYLDPERMKRVREAERRFQLLEEPGKSTDPYFSHPSPE